MFVIASCNYDDVVRYWSRTDYPAPWTTGLLYAMEFVNEHSAAAHPASSVGKVLSHAFASSYTGDLVHFIKLGRNSEI